MIKSQCQCHALPSLVFIPQSNGYGYSSQSSMVAEFYVLLINYNSRRWSCRFSRSEYWQTSEWLHFVFKPLLKEHVYFALAFSFFGQLRSVKVQSVSMTDSGLWMLQFSSQLNKNVSYESWDLQLKFEASVRSLKLIVWPQEVSEVTEVKMKKILGKNSKIVSFWPRKMLYTSKESS